MIIVIVNHILSPAFIILSRLPTIVGSPHSIDIKLYHCFLSSKKSHITFSIDMLYILEV